MSEFRDRIAIVTGAASGIGAALVEALLEAGAVVIATDVNSSALEARPSHPRLRAEALDVTDQAAVHDLVEKAVADHGRLDLMFNNAGIVVGGNFEDTDDIAWRRVVDINFLGVLHGTRAAYAQMRRQGSGHIVNTSSSAGVMPVAQSVAYAATKHAVVGLSTSLRAEAASTGVRVNVVVPGLVDTAIFDSATNVGGYDYARAIKRVPFARVSPARAAAYILDGVAKDKQFITFPAYNRMLVGLNRVAPALMSRVINPRNVKH